MNFDELHDAIIEEIRLTDWMTGRLELRIRDSKGQRLLVFDAVTSLKLGRKFDWGPSNQINTATLHSIESIRRLDIEVQSGDTIEIEFRSWEAATAAKE